MLRKLFGKKAIAIACTFALVLSLMTGISFVNVNAEDTVLSTNKDTYCLDEPIIVTADSNDSGAWVGLHDYHATSTPSYWWYWVSDYKNTSVDILTTEFQYTIADYFDFDNGQNFTIAIHEGSGVVATKDIKIEAANMNASLDREDKTYTVGQAINVTASSNCYKAWVAIYDMTDPAPLNTWGFGGYYLKDEPETENILDHVEGNLPEGEYRVVGCYSGQHVATINTFKVVAEETTTPEVTTPEVTTPEVTTPEVTTPEVTTEPVETTTEDVTSTPEVTTEPVETTTEDVTTTPEETTPEVTTVPGESTEPVETTTEGPKKPTAPTVVVRPDKTKPYYFAWNMPQDAESFNVYVNGEKVAATTVPTYDASEYFAKAAEGKYVVGVTSVKGDLESDMTTIEITVEKPIETTAEEPTVIPEEPTTIPVVTTKAPVVTTKKTTPTTKKVVKAPGKTKVKKAIKKKKSPKKIKITLKKIKGAKGYQVAVYKNKKKAKKNKKAIKKKYSTKAKFTVKSKKFKKAKKLFVRARAYALDGKKKVFGKWSKVKKVKIK